MRMHQIEVDDVVFTYLQYKAKAFVDSPNDVLRRELPLGQRPRPDATITRPPENGSKSAHIPAGTPMALREILEVFLHMRNSGSKRSDATSYVARRLGVTYQSIIDKYTR